MPVVLSRPTLSILRTKVPQDRAFFWWMPGSMDETCGFGYIPRMIYISFSALDRTLTHLGVSIWRGGFSSQFTDVTRTVGICPSSIIIRSFYYNFVNRFWNFHAFKHIKIFFKSNRFKIEYLYTRLLDPAFGHTVKKKSSSSAKQILSFIFAPWIQPSIH